MSIKLYDCTIREGKPFNAFENGAEILVGLEKGIADAGIEYVDVGYLTEATFSEDFAFYENIDRAENLIPDEGITEWVISIRIGRNELNLIPECQGIIKTIRFTVPFNEPETLKTYASFIKEKGYNVICELHNTFGYKDIELLQMVNIFNETGVSQVTITDNPGRVDENDLQRVYYLLNNNLNPEIRIGSRISDALKSAYHMAQKLIEYNSYDKREVVLEGSLFGIGDYKGNLVLEVIADHVNEFCGGTYNLESLYKTIGKYVQPIVGNQFWGYHPAYYFAGKYRIDDDYAKYLMEKSVPLEKIHEAMKEIAKTEEFKEFDEAVAEKAYNALPTDC